MFAGVKPVVSGADLAICHMETVYGKDGGPYTGYPAFKSPPQVAAALKDTGYDSCSTASNHSLDGGADGIRRTLGAMDAVGLRHTGSARSAAEASRPALMKAGRAKVAQLSYTYATNDIPPPEGSALGGQSDRRGHDRRRRAVGPRGGCRRGRRQPPLGHGMAAGARPATAHPGPRADRVPHRGTARTST